MNSINPLEIKNIKKEFLGTVAVKDIDMTIKSGEVHALLGENGAGKSTLMKIIAGTFTDYEGTILIDGKEVRLDSPIKSKDYGIGMVYQELSLARPITIAENMLVGKLPVKYGLFLDHKEIRRITKMGLKKVGLGNIDPFTLVENLSQHEMQLVEIAKVLMNDPKIIVMDEPTSSLSTGEVEMLFEIIDELKRQGLAIIYISHHLPEIFQVADTVTVMRDGGKIGTNDIEDVTTESLVKMMIGKSKENINNNLSTKEIGKKYLEVNNLTRKGFFHNVSFSVREGEILGVCGIAGAGRTEMVRSICGIDPIDSGIIKFEGKEIKIKSQKNALSFGIAYLTEDRKAQGLFLKESVAQNLSAATIYKDTTMGFYNPENQKLKIDKLIKDLDILPPVPTMEVNGLSGGNQQKVLMGKWLATEPNILVLDEPTRGVDVGAKALLHEEIKKLSKQGLSIILISSDLPELINLSDRAIVMRRGHVIGELKKEELTEEAALLAANGERKLNDAG